MLPCHSCYIYGTWRSKEVGGFKTIVWRETGGGGGATYKVKGGGAIFMGELTPQLFYQNYLPISVFFGVKMYTHYIPSY